MSSETVSPYPRIRFSKEKTKIPYFENEDLECLFSEYTHFYHENTKIGLSKKIEGQQTILAMEDLPAGSVIFVHTDKIISANTRTSIQVGPNKHIEPGPNGENTNHSCEPNTVVRTRINESSDTATISLITHRNVKKGEELTFDYATTESFVTPQAMLFKCLCGSKKCRGKIMGFNNISELEREYLLETGLLANHLL